MKLELISFKLCPYVQRSVITLLEKAVPFDINYINLSEPPAWFLSISPTGKVPVLRVNDTVLFESAVINEYLDETHPPSLLPNNPLKKALNRAWIEFASNLLTTLYKAILCNEKDSFNHEIIILKKELEQLEKNLGDGPYFNGDTFGLLDTAYAPVFKHLSVVENIEALKLHDTLPKINRWKDTLLQRKSVRASVVDDFESLYHAYLKSNNTYLAQRM
ncbi:MAG: glutathione S-transferase family protein [Gammaproteobacteria bacterium]|nr:glutathione S-transferase family protein [Gammaproteobacteria bacterium]